eukprot:TRINITY_DN10238_c0_g1_i1.p1 TRINITY_DN10238_c0_g1~~TRINITY_DN10238_c0_g1_i1.p1  ORF type:complete len:169 (+),score=18.45 TRINITY_DN10238_c0_g1_i1:686-1192(+)
MAMVPEIKFGILIQTNSMIGELMGNLILAETLPAILSELKTHQQPPPNPRNLTRYEGQYEASLMEGLFYMTVNVTVIPNTSMLNLNLTSWFFGDVVSAGSLGSGKAEWVRDDIFQTAAIPGQPCMEAEGEVFMSLIQFVTDTSSGIVTQMSYEAMDPFYGIDFVRLSK